MHLIKHLAAMALTAVSALPLPAQAGIVLSQVVVDIAPGGDTAQDIEIANDGSEVTYVVVEPSEIVSPGLADEKRVPITDPGVGGLLVSPQRLILQPGERKTIRIAAIAARGDRDRVYRVTVKPVAGPVSAQVTALKLLVGYDLLVLVRPAKLAPKVTGTRAGNQLSMRNDGNTNVELFEGKQCRGVNKDECTDLPSKRLYPGQSWQVTLEGSAPVQYRVAVGATSSVQSF